MKQDWERIFPDADHRWTMGLRRAESVQDYFRIEDDTRTVLRERDHWLTSDPNKYAAMLPGCEAALAETNELAQSFGSELVVRGDSDMERLLALGRAWEPDFVWMHPGLDGIHRLLGGVVCFPSSWALGDKLGRPMSDVHEPVPGLNATLARQIDTFLAKLEPGVAWRRENWGLSRDSQYNHHPDRIRQSLDETVTLEQVWIRLEHQLLLRLPRSGSVLFGIRVDVQPLADVFEDATAASRFIRSLRTMSETAAKYKGVHAAREKILACCSLQSG